MAAGPGCSANSSSPEPEALSAEKSLWSGMHRWIWLSIFGPVGWFSQKAGLLFVLAAREVMPVCDSQMDFPGCVDVGVLLAGHSVLLCT